jgi:hypothetical protein
VQSRQGSNDLAGTKGGSGGAQQDIIFDDFSQHLNLSEIDAHPRKPQYKVPITRRITFMNSTSGAGHASSTLASWDCITARIAFRKETVNNCRNPHRATEDGDFVPGSSLPPENA